MATANSESLDATFVILRIFVAALNEQTRAAFIFRMPTQVGVADVIICGGLTAPTLVFQLGTSSYISYPVLKGLTVVNDTVKVKPVAPTTKELGVRLEVEIRAGVNPVMSPSCFTAFAFPVLSTKNA